MIEHALLLMWLLWLNHEEFRRLSVKTLKVYVMSSAQISVMHLFCLICFGNETSDILFEFIIVKWPLLN